MTKEELMNERARRGARYAAAVTAFKNAYIRLAGVDVALRNSRVGHGEVRGFAVLPDPILLQHPEFVPTVKANWTSEIRDEHNALLAQFVEEK